MRAAPQQRGLILATLTVSATAAAFGTMFLAAQLAGAGSSIAILAAVLTLTRARRSADEKPHAWRGDLWRLPLVAGLAAATAALLHRNFVLGAALFVSILGLSAWLPAFGARARALATALALPLIAVLIAPAAPHAPGGLLVDLLLVVLAAWLAQMYARLALALGRRLTLHGVKPALLAPKRTPQRGRAYVRMALQMVAALSAAFVAGHFLFAAHWSWCVLTAYIVCAGSPSRGEAAYKGLMRLMGALAGTLAAALLQRLFVPHGVQAGAVIFASLFVGVWLREFNYAFWAACMTLIMAMLQGLATTPGSAELNTRLAAILVGALCAMGPAWLLMPLSTRAYARRVFADTLTAFDASLRTDGPQARHELTHCLARLERLAPVLRLHRFVVRAAPDSDHPALWVARTLDCSRHIQDFTGDKASLIRAIGLTRRTLARREGSVYQALAGVEKVARDGNGKI